ncbi:MAG TPA: 2Fe-2S iron-sulfur cluster binding domain-containing protein [Novosphingobium sp.]|nr:2Fe-2S iron-sulfur cluster binding domain-containing protein [Novosphingobium sp.]
MDLAEHRVREAAGAGAFACREDETLLAGAIRSGGGAIPVGCRAGGCGMCKVRILAGSYRTAKMSRAHVSEAEQRQGYVLACRTWVSSEVEFSRAGAGVPDRGL